MQHIRFVLSLAGGLAMSGTALLADNACNYSDPDTFGAVAESYADQWVMNHQAGYVLAGPMAMPFPAADDGDSVVIAYIDGDLVITHPEAQEPLVLEWADEPAWVFNEEALADGAPAPLLTSDDVELAMGCPNDRAARLIGRTTAVVDGTQMDFTYRLIVVGEDAMYGVMHVASVANGIPVNAWRTVLLTR